jgi:tetratricopeptide (TPR) repeat protein
MKPTKRVLFTFFSILIPLIFFILLELFFTVIKYGGDISLFIPVEKNPKYLRINPNVGSRYFINIVQVPETTNDWFEKEKPKDCFRIFVLGGSSAFGYPYGHNGSFSKFLSQRLALIFPEKKFEIINLGMPAINSFSLLDLTDEVLQQNPDTIIIYSGHNEYYGALGVGSTETLGEYRNAITLFLKLERFRTFLFLRKQIRNIAGLFKGDIQQSSSSDVNLMEHMVKSKHIPFASDLYKRGTDFFKQNLIEIVEKAKKKNTPVFLCNLVSNLQDQPPFISFPVDSTKEVKIIVHLEKGLEFEQKGEYGQALEYYLKAIQIDSAYAKTQFCLGKCYEFLNFYQKAKEAYKKAKDLDALRFRAPSQFNEIIRDVANENSLVLVDVQKEFEDNSENKLLGNNLFLEHLHPNTYGYFLIAQAIANEMNHHNLFKQKWPEEPFELDSVLWSNRAITPLDSELASLRIKALTNNWPFVENSFASNENFEPENKIQDLSYKVWRKTITWEKAHVQAAEHYQSTNQLLLAAKEYDALILETPYNISPYLRSGTSYLQLGKLESAKQRFLASLKIEESLKANKYLGAILLGQNSPDKAIPYLTKGLAIEKDDLEIMQNLIVANLMIGELERAELLIFSFEKKSPNKNLVIQLKNRLKLLKQGLK